MSEWEMFNSPITLQSCYKDMMLSQFTLEILAQKCCNINVYYMKKIISLDFLLESKQQFFLCVFYAGPVWWNDLTVCLTILPLQVLTTTTWTQSSTSTWRARCSTACVGTWCWAAGAMWSRATASSWPPTTSTPWSMWWRWATDWSPSSSAGSSSGVGSHLMSSQNYSGCCKSMFILGYYSLF